MTRIDMEMPVPVIDSSWRHAEQDEVSMAWDQLYDALDARRLPSLEWSLRWMPDGTLDRLWRVSSLVFVDVLTRRLEDTYWYQQNASLDSPGGPKKLAQRRRKTWSAPSIELLRSRQHELYFACLSVR